MYMTPAEPKACDGLSDRDVGTDFAGGGQVVRCQLSKCEPRGYVSQLALCPTITATADGPEIGQCIHDSEVFRIQVTISSRSSTTMWGTPCLESLMHRPIPNPRQNLS